MLPLRWTARIGAVLLVGIVPACRCSEGSGEPRGAAPLERDVEEAAASASASDASTAGRTNAGNDDEDAPVGDAGTRFLEAGPRALGDLDAPPDPACTGAEVSFAGAIVDTRCAISSARAKKLRALLERDGGAGALRQEGRLVEEGRVALRLVNRGASSLALPLSFHGKLPAFSVLAEDERHTLYELAPPLLDLKDPASGNRSHFARIVLSPGGAAVATLTISPVVAKVLGRGPTDPCKDGKDAGGAACTSARLAKGRYVLHVGQLLTDVEVGLPARVDWELP